MRASPWLFSFIFLAFPLLTKAQSPVIYLVGDTIDTIDVLTTWIEPGFIAVDAQLNNISTEVQITSNLDTKHLGSYRINYQVIDQNGLQGAAFRKVRVLDLKAPVLQLLGDDSLLIDANSTFTDPGVAVSDNYQNSVQATVAGTVNVSELGNYTLSYCAVDSSGNQAACLQRIVLVRDISPPKLQLNGPSFIRHPHCESFQDSGYSVFENYPKGLHITVSGSWRPEKNHIPGTYRIHYRAIDTGGNVDTLSRVIRVVDDMAPSIELLGPKYVRTPIYVPYQDSGFVAKDSCNAAPLFHVFQFGSFVNTFTRGIYYLKYSVLDSSLNTSNTVVRTINVYDMHDTLSTSPLPIAADISIFPNPVTSHFQIDFGPVQPPENLSVLIMNITGKVVSEVRVSDLQSNQIEVLSAHLEKGYYLVEVLTNGQRLARIPIVKS